MDVCMKVYICIIQISQISIFLLKFTFNSHKVIEENLNRSFVTFENEMKKGNLLIDFEN